jgi:pyruvate/2-oxoglutarate dehydrogenase complex dihydrolipoamide dehydrogenase (E3) component
LLVYPADFIREMQHAKKIGIDIPSWNMDWDQIAQRMWERIGLNQEIEKQLMTRKKLTVFKARGNLPDLKQ